MRQTFGEAVYSMLRLLPESERRPVYDKFVYESGRAAFEIGFWLFDPRQASKVDESRVTCPVLVGVYPGSRSEVNKNRLESFSDGVIAIILTIMVLELKVPKEPTLPGLAQLWPVYVAYLLSFGNVFMMRVAHHDIVGGIRTVDYPVLFANGVLLFFMSLVPFALSFASETHWTEPVPVALYGVVMLAALRAPLAALLLYALVPLFRVGRLVLGGSPARNT